MTYAEELLAALQIAEASGFDHTAAILKDWLEAELERQAPNAIHLATIQSNDGIGPRAN
ncbi:MAG: hypothetical protein AAF438_19630 [Pseudomonadota bacterium]